MGASPTLPVAMRLWFVITCIRPVLVNLFLWVLLVRPMRLSRRWHALCIVLLLADVAKDLILQYAGGNWLMPDLPAPIYAAVSLLRGLTTLVFIGLVLCCFLRLPILLVRRMAKAPPKEFPARRIAPVLLSIASAILLVSFSTALLPPRLATLELPVEGLPADLDGYRILHISDIHADPIAGAWRTRAIVRRANAAAPDLVCLTGDYADGTHARFAPALAPLAGLQARDGVFACTGNHEWYPPARSPDWPAAYRAMGLQLLDGATAAISRGAARILVSGMDDEQSGATLASRLASSGFAAAAPLPGEFRIFLKHRPTQLGPLAEAKVHLVLSGHTHGGQFPLLDRIVSAFNEGHISGLYSLPPATTLHVSPGASQWNGLPFRLFRPSEITILVLRPLRTE